MVEIFYHYVQQIHNKRVMIFNYEITDELTQQNICITINRLNNCGNDRI